MVFLLNLFNKIIIITINNKYLIADLHVINRIYIIKYDAIFIYKPC
jgi:hypothetical protein